MSVPVSIVSWPFTIACLRDLEVLTYFQAIYDCHWVYFPTLFLSNKLYPCSLLSRVPAGSKSALIASFLRSSQGLLYFCLEKAFVRFLHLILSLLLFKTHDICRSQKSPSIEAIHLDKLGRSFHHWNRR